MKIEINNLDLHYGSFHALKGVNLAIREKEITAFIGPSGCGKSTLLKTLNRMNDLVEGCKITGQVLLDGVDIYRDIDTALLRKRVGMVFQKPNPFPMSIYDNIAFGPRTHGIRSKAKGFIAHDADLLTICRDASVLEIVNAAQKGDSGDVVLPRDSRTYRIFASPVLREDKVRGVVLLALDISARYAAEASRREFTANVSHELKTPLTSISGYAEIIESGIARQEDVPAFAGKIRTEAKRLVALVNDILELSQLDEKQGLGAKEHVTLLPMLNALRDSFAPIAAEKGVALSVEGCDATVEGYPVLLRELFHNLIDNAIKYTPAGGSVTVQLSQQEGHIRCTVKDTGIGIPQEHQAHVFERFYRVDKSHSRQTGGTGLGLAIVKHVAEVHQAQVQLESKPQEGTAVSVVF